VSRHWLQQRPRGDEPPIKTRSPHRPIYSLGLPPNRPAPPYRSFRGLLEHLATLTRNQVRFAGTRDTVPMLADPASAQRDAFDLIGVPIPLTLK
jgi:hypothetical protein